MNEPTPPSARKILMGLAAAVGGAGYTLACPACWFMLGVTHGAPHLPAWAMPFAPIVMALWACDCC